MKVKIKLYGTLSKYYSDYDHEHGFYTEVPAGMDVDGLATFLGIPKTKIGMVSVNGNPAKAEDTLTEEAAVELFQPIFGG